VVNKVYPWTSGEFGETGGERPHKMKSPADTLLNHRAGKGLGEPEIAGLGFPNYIYDTIVGSQTALAAKFHWESQPHSRADQWVNAL